METTKLTLKLAVPMTQEREMEIHREISKVIKEISGIEEQKKRLSPLKARMNELNLSIEAQTVEAEVDCEERFDSETGLYKTWRLDTNVVFKTRPCDPEERQVNIPGIETDARKRIEELNKSEEQVSAGSPEEAEQLREQRLAEEAATRAFDSITTGGTVEILTGDVWVSARVENKIQYHFEVNGKLYDVSKHGVSWKPPATWQDVVAESQERERQAQIAALTTDQAKDQQATEKKLLRAPKRPPRVKVVDENDVPLIPPQEIPASAAPADEHPAKADGDDELAF